MYRYYEGEKERKKERKLFLLDAQNVPRKCRFQYVDMGNY